MFEYTYISCRCQGFLQGEEISFSWVLSPLAVLEIVVWLWGVYKLFNQQVKYIGIYCHDGICKEVAGLYSKSRSSPPRHILTSARVGPYYYITHIYIPPAYVPQTPLPLMDPRPRTYQTPIFKIVKFEAPTFTRNGDCGLV
jgi:hypothetical protein